MTTIIACHEVNDTDHWVASPKRAEVLTKYGASNIRTFIDPQSPKRVAVLMDVEDFQAMAAVVADPPDDLAEAMRSDGVVRETMSVYVAS